MCIRDRAQRAGAFGGGREGVQRAELERNRASALAQAQAQAFLNAQQQQGARQQTSAAGLASIAPEYGRIAGQQAGLGQIGQAATGQDINTLLGIGGLQQQQGQRELDVARSNLLAAQALPFQQVGFMSDIFRGVPALQQTTSQTRTPGPSTGSQMLGLGIAGLGAIGSAGGFGNFFNFGAPVGRR